MMFHSMLTTKLANVVRCFFVRSGPRIVAFDCIFDLALRDD